MHKPNLKTKAEKGKNMRAKAVEPNNPSAIVRKDMYTGQMN